MKKEWFGLLLLLFLSGCGHHRGHYKRTLLSRKRIAAIKVGAKKEDVLAAFGKPMRQSIYRKKGEDKNTETLVFERRKPSGALIVFATAMTIATCGLYALARFPVFFLQDVARYTFEFVDNALVCKSKKSYVSFSGEVLG